MNTIRLIAGLPFTLAGLLCIAASWYYWSGYWPYHQAVEATGFFASAWMYLTCSILGIIAAAACSIPGFCLAMLGCFISGSDD